MHGSEPDFSVAFFKLEISAQIGVITCAVCYCQLQAQVLLGYINCVRMMTLCSLVE